MRTVAIKVLKKKIIVLRNNLWDNLKDKRF